MSGASRVAKFGLFDLLMKPLRMASRRKYIIITVPEQHGAGYFGEIHAPWTREGDNVVDPTMYRFAQCLRVGPREHPGERYVPDDLPVRADKFRPQRVEQSLGVISNLAGSLFKRGYQRLQVRLRGVVIRLHVRLGHVGEPVEVVGVVRGQAAQRGGAHEPVAKALVGGAR